MIRLVEVSKKGEQYDPAIGMNKVTFNLREVFVNPNMIVSMRVDQALEKKNRKNRLFKDLNENAEFTTLTLNAGSNGKTITVVGSPVEIKNKLGIRNLLNG